MISAPGFGFQPGYEPEKSTCIPASSKTDFSCSATAILVDSTEERVRFKIFKPPFFNSTLAILLEASTKSATSGDIL